MSNKKIILVGDTLTVEEIQQVEKAYAEHPAIASAIKEYNMTYSVALGALRKLAQAFYESPLEDRLRALMLRHAGVDKSMISRLKAVLGLPKELFSKFVDGTYSMQQVLGDGLTAVGGASSASEAWASQGLEVDTKRWYPALKQSIETMTPTGKKMRLVFVHKGYKVQLVIRKVAKKAKKKKKAT